MRKYMNLNRHDWLVLSSALALILFLIPVNVEAEDTQNLSISDDTYLVTFAGEIPDINRLARNNYNFEILNKKTHQVSQFVLEYPYRQIEDMDLKMDLLKDNKLIIEAKWRKRPKASTGLHIVDIKDNTLIDQFWCYDPVLSPSRRFWVYEKFFAPHGLKATQTTVVLIYDMEKSPLENRVPVEDYTEWELEQVGLPIYPEPYVEAQTYVLKEEQEENPFWYLRSSPFLWSADANDVVFLCNHQECSYIVRVDLSPGIRKPKIFTAPIDVASFIKPTLPEAEKKREAAILHTVGATDIAWDGPGHIILKPSKAYYTLQDTIKLAVP